MVSLIKPARPKGERTAARSRSPRLAMALATVGALGASLLVSASMAQAATVTPYNINGVVPDDGAARFDDGFGSTQELGPINASGTKLGVIHTAATPMLGTTNPNAQVDLRRIWLDSKKDSTGQDTWLYFGWERDSSNGSGVIMYEFMKGQPPTGCEYATKTDAQLIASCNPWKNRSSGDFILVWDQVGSKINIIKRTWSVGAGGKLVLDAGVSLTAGGDAVAKTSADGFFGEASVNLSTTVFNNTSNTCVSYGNVVPGTVTGNSDTADYKDTVLKDLTGKVNISNCGAITVKKVTDPAGGTGSFPYTVARSGGSDIFYTGTNKKTAPGTLTGDGDLDTVSDLIAGTDYTLAEDLANVPSYENTSVVCTTKNGTGTVYTLRSGNAPTATTSFPVVEGETTACVITNTLKKATLVVKKLVVNDNGGTKQATDFAFKVNGGTSTGFVQDGTDTLKGLNSLTVDAGTYNVVENGLPIAGYTTTSSGCTNVELAPGGTATCTITNNDQPGTLIVKKLVVNDNGGTGKATDFSFKVNGGSSTSFVQDGTDVLKGLNSLTVNAGTYSVTENPAVGYGTTYDNCTNVAVGIGETKTCLITNSDNKASPEATTTQRWTIHDSLSLSGFRSGGSPAAQATFKLYSDPGCTTQVGTSETVAIASNGKASTANGVGVSDPGTYYWIVSSDGNSFNDPFETTCQAEITKIGAKDYNRDQLN